MAGQTLLPTIGENWKSEGGDSNCTKNSYSLLQHHARTVMLFYEEIK
jgi:hypothetical protein